MLEMKTYRYKGHSMSDPAKYRTKEELSQKKDEDPILHLKAVIHEHNIASDEELAEIDARIKILVDASVTFAEESPYPEPHELYEDVYMQKDYPYIME